MIGIACTVHCITHITWRSANCEVLVRGALMTVQQTHDIHPRLEDHMNPASSIVRVNGQINSLSQISLSDFRAVVQLAEMNSETGRNSAGDARRASMPCRTMLQSCCGIDSDDLQTQLKLIWRRWTVLARKPWPPSLPRTSLSRALPLLSGRPWVLLHLRSCQLTRQATTCSRVIELKQVMCSCQ
jgi:hypothetical protein